MVDSSCRVFQHNHPRSRCQILRNHIHERRSPPPQSGSSRDPGARTIPSGKIHPDIFGGTFFPIGSSRHPLPPLCTFCQRHESGGGVTDRRQHSQQHHFGRQCAGNSCPREYSGKNSPLLDTEHPFPFRSPPGRRSFSRIRRHNYPLAQHWGKRSLLLQHFGKKMATRFAGCQPREDPPRYGCAGNPKASWRREGDRHG